MNAPVRPGRPNPLRVLGYRAYAYLWAGALISNIGTWMETIAVGVHVTHTTGKSGWTGTVAALAFLPSVVLGPLSGALVDRMERRRYLILVSVAQAVVAAALAVLAFTDLLTLPAIVVLMTLAGCASTLLNPAFSAQLANTVPDDSLTSAMTLNSAQFNLARITGPVIANAIIAVGGIAWAFGFNAISFLAVLVAVMVALRPEPKPTHAPEPLLAGMRTGVKVALGDRGIVGALALTLVTTVLISPFIGLVPVMAIKVFGLGASETSLLVTCQGAGAVVSAVLSAQVADAFGRRRLVEGAAWLVGPLTAAYWLSPTFALALP
ncbi:MAG TPA: MFS transporter, partial [Longimicrobium sp.]|nr:MFS transporter [Longimicrobium sp.]